ncbi:MAG: hypothetical protein ABIH42_04035 [Planctomycetota bacterium]
MTETTSKEEVWELVEGFFYTNKIFNQQYCRYEELIRKYAEEIGIDRGNMRLSVEKVTELVDSKVLEGLCSKLENLQDVGHHMFRNSNSIEMFDKYITDLYHEMSILKEEHYAVMMLASLYEKGENKDLQERDNIMDEVHLFFPRKLQQIQNLFKKAKSQLELLLKIWNEEKVLVRSLYLFGDSVVNSFYPSGIDEVYRVIYLSGVEAEGYLVAAESFQSSGFNNYAQEAINKAEKAFKNSKPNDNELLKQIKRRIRELKKKL